MGINLPKLIGKALAKYGKPLGIKSCTLTLVTPGTRTPGAASGGTNPTSTSYAAKGWIESYTTGQIDGTLVTSEDRKISLLGSTIAGGAIPVTGAKITFDGVTYRIMGSIGVDRDPAGVVYVCQCRR